MGGCPDNYTTMSPIPMMVRPWIRPGRNQTSQAQFRSRWRLCEGSVMPASTLRHSTLRPRSYTSSHTKTFDHVAPAVSQGSDRWLLRRCDLLLHPPHLVVGLPACLVHLHHYCLLMGRNILVFWRLNVPANPRLRMRPARFLGENFQTTNGVCLLL